MCVCLLCKGPARLVRSSSALASSLCLSAGLVRVVVSVFRSVRPSPVRLPWAPFTYIHTSHAIGENIPDRRRAKRQPSPFETPVKSGIRLLLLRVGDWLYMDLAICYIDSLKLRYVTLRYVKLRYVMLH